MNKKIRNALISVYSKDGLETIIQQLHSLGTKIFSTGGTEKFITDLGIPCIPVESLTKYPPILGGRVKTLHPNVFGGILARSNNELDKEELKTFNIPIIDLVIVDLYPFEETVNNTTDENLIIEKIDIGGPSMIRAAAKNYTDVVVIAAKDEYPLLGKILADLDGETTIEQRRTFASKAFEVCTGYDIAISNYFSGNKFFNPFVTDKSVLRYGENPHQQAIFYGDLEKIFIKLNGKELSYNNIVDIDAATQLMNEFDTKGSSAQRHEVIFAIIKHTNVCGIASRNTVEESWFAALAGDPESAFGGILITNATINIATAKAINELFFEVLIAPSFEEEALDILKKKKNRIILQNKPGSNSMTQNYRSVLNGILIQQVDHSNYSEWKEVGGHESNDIEKQDLVFANVVCKHLKSNAIAIIKNMQLIGKGCGQTSRIDALRQALEKSVQFNFDLQGAVLASDAFFPFDDCVKIAHQAGVRSFIQPGGSIRDNDSIQYCKENDLAMIITGVRHFKH